MSIVISSMYSLEFTKTSRSYDIFVWLLSLGKSPNIFRFNFLHLFNEEEDTIFSKIFFPALTVYSFSPMLAHGQTLALLDFDFLKEIDWWYLTDLCHTTCVSQELVSIDWSHRCIPICFYSIWFQNYKKENKTKIPLDIEDRGNSLLFDLHRGYQIQLYSICPAEKCLD